MKTGKEEQILQTVFLHHNPYSCHSHSQRPRAWAQPLLFQQISWKTYKSSRLFQTLGWMGFQNSKGTLSELQNITKPPTRCQESIEVLFIQMIVKVGDIFSTVTFQIFNIVLKGRCSANTISVFFLLLICSELGYTGIPLAATPPYLKMMASSSIGRDSQQFRCSSISFPFTPDAFMLYLFIYLLSIQA